MLLYSYSVIAQEDKLFKSFGVDNPIAYKFVMTIAQDNKGFMWFGAQEGLHRFDGYQLVSFHYDASLPNSLSSNVISRIITDKNQQLWVGTRGGGINLYREKTQDFIHITSKTQGAELTNDTINTLFEDSSGNIWVGTENGLNILSQQKGRWVVKQIHQELGKPKSLSHNTIHAITESNDQHIWVGTNGGGISVFDLQGNFIKVVKDENKHNDNTNKFVNTLYTDAEGNIWIGTVNQGILKYIYSTNDFIHYLSDSDDDSTINSNTIQNIYQDSKQNVWISTDNGLSVYHHKTKGFSRYKYAANNPYSLSNDYIITTFEDKNNMMWIGTFTGVNRWDPAMTTFTQYTGKNNPDLKSLNITSFVEMDKNSTIFSSYIGGIYQISHQNKKVMRIDFNNYFSDLRVMTLFPDGDHLWIGTRSSGLYKANVHTKQVVKFSHDAKNIHSLSADGVTDIIKDRQGNIWISTFHKGLNKYNNDGTFTRYGQNKTTPELGPSNNSILHLLEDEQGIIWLATYGGGINRFDPGTGTFIHIMSDKKKATSISSDLAWYMLLDKSGDLWISTQAAGLNKLSYQNRIKKNFEFKHFDTKDGMKSQTVYGMVQDTFGDIWLSSNKGVSRYSSEKESFKHFDLSHGLVDLDYNHGSIFKGLNNMIYFGAGKGFSTVLPDNSQHTLLAPEVRLTNVYKLNEPINFDNALTESSVLALQHTDQLVSFEYVGLNYSNPESTFYKYRLLGFDQEWIDAGKSRRATYTNLPAGSYQLQVIAGNSDNIWSEPTLLLNITVQPAPWNTWWAYLLYAIAVASILLVYSRFLNRKLLVEQQQKSYLKKQVKEKTQKLQSQNSELEHANKLLEKSATVDKVTGVRSRRYLDIYIEQTSQLMNQIHQNILPVQRSTLPRLYILMVQVNELSQVSNSQLINITDLLLFSRNSDDLVVRWSDDTFAVIGYEKDNNASELAARLADRFEKQFDQKIPLNVAYSFYPFNSEQPMDISWDQVSVMIELGLKLTSADNTIAWLGLCEPKIQPFSYLEVIQGVNLAALKHNIHVKEG
ncbi:MAG: ligand-binding sensor domain-containing protein/GGDEF domain-containing protein [Alteromonadaceae bacterium]|jgi:ligand-binding sensor domain-containing protein/GGDEF domain-containing protein